MYRETQQLDRGMPIRVYARGWVLALTVLASACGSGTVTGGTPEPDGPDSEIPVSKQPASAKARVKFKGGQRLATDLATGLDLPRGEMCRELASRDCFAVHNIALGGVEPYQLRIDEPLPSASVSTTIAVDRIALSVCGERVARDFADPDRAVIFGDITSADATPTSTALESIVDDLYKRILRREVNLDERTGLVDLFAELAADTSEPARQWAQLSCYAVATTMENLFY